MPVATVLPLLIGLLVLGGCAAVPADGIPGQVLVPIVYVTDRNLNEDTRPARYYGGQRGEPQAGTVSVAVSTLGNDTSEFADWRRWEPRREGARNRDELVSITPAGGADLAGVISDYAAASGDNTALVYIHGFRRRFEKTAVNFASLVYNISPDALPVLYSWPSTGNLLEYKQDVENLEWSIDTLESLLTQLLELSEIETVHVVAHSLGTFALLEAITAVLQHPSEKLTSKLGQLVLVSPDIARERFESAYLPLIREKELRVTIYAAENDVPLRTSRRVNKTERLGDAKGRVPLYPGTETVLVSEVVSILNSHDAHLEVTEVQADLAYVVNEGLPADSRPTLERVDTTDGTYWRIKAMPR